MIADENMDYQLGDVDLNDVEFVRSLSPAQFHALFDEAMQQPAARPEDLAGPRTRRSGESVTLFGPPAGTSSRRRR